MKFRKANISDLPILNQISVTSKKHWNYPDSWIENWMDSLTLKEDHLKAQQILLLELNEEIKGFCAISEDEAGYEIEHLWLLPESIGKGYGKLLLSRALKDFVLKDKAVFVDADPNAEAFYRSQGFSTFEKVASYPEGRFLPRMKKNS